MTDFAIINHEGIKAMRPPHLMPPESWVPVFGDGTDTDKAAFVKTPWLWAASDLVASYVMTVPFAFVNGTNEWKNGQEDKPPKGFEWFDDWSLLSYKVVMSVNNYGRAYLFNNLPVELRYLNPRSMTEVYDRDGRLIGFKRQTKRGTAVPLEAEQVVHFYHFKDPLTEDGRPSEVYPAVIAKNASDTLQNFQYLMSRYFKSGAIGTKVLKSSRPPNQSEVEEIKSWIGRTLAGVRNAFNTPILGADAEFMNLSDSLKDFYNHEAIKDARRDVEVSFDLPETAMNQAANLATKEADQLEMIERVIVPYCDWIATTVNKQLLDKSGWRLVYRPNEMQIMQRDENEVADSLMKYVAAGYTPEVASDLLGIDLTDEQRAALRETQTKPEEIILERTALGGVSRRENLEVTQGQTTRALEIGQLERWVQNRLKRGKSVDPEDFTAETLTADEVKAIVERETGAAEDSPFLKASLIPDDDARNKIERQLTTAVYKVLRDMPAAVIGDNYLGWEQRLSEQRDALRSALETPLRTAVLLGTASGRQYVEQVLGNQKAELSFNWGLVNDAAIAWLLTDAEGFGTGYVDVLTNQLLENTADKIRTEIAAWIQNQEPLSALIDTLVNDYMFDRSRAEAIAQTEVTRAYAWGNRAAWRGSGVVSGMQWVTANDERVCPVCAPLGGLKFGEGEAIPADIDEQKRRGLKVGLDEPFVHPGGRGAADKFKGETFDLPPAHPRCRCSVVPLI